MALLRLFRMYRRCGYGYCNALRYAITVARRMR